MSALMIGLLFTAVSGAVAAVLIRSRSWALVCAGVAGYAAGLLVGAITAFDTLLKVAR